MVSTHLKNISQNRSFPQIEVKIKNIRNHYNEFLGESYFFSMAGYLRFPFSMGPACDPVVPHPILQRSLQGRAGYSLDSGVPIMPDIFHFFFGSLEFLFFCGWRFFLFSSFLGRDVLGRFCFWDVFCCKVLLFFVSFRWRSFFFVGGDVLLLFVPGCLKVFFMCGTSLCSASVKVLLMDVDGPMN